jgi:uncharacterized protein (DUF2252 family)
MASSRPSQISRSQIPWREEGCSRCEAVRRRQSGAGRFEAFVERRSAGRALRRRLSRSEQAFWRPSPRRQDPLEILRAIHRGRLEKILPVKYGRMAASPFGYFRGAASVMAADLAGLPTTGIHVQICGDAHVSNLGAYAAPDGHLVFDINDFDESVHGPWEWDLKRLATSLVLAAREAGEPDRGCREAVELLVESYRQSLDEFAEMSALQLFRYQIRSMPGGNPVGAALRKAERETPQRTLQKLTVAGRGAPRFANRPPLLTPVSGDLHRQILGALVRYRETVYEDRHPVLAAYRPVAIAFKAVGVGSLGTRDYVVLCEGSAPKDLLFLQVKEEPPSCYAPFVRSSPGVINQGQRVARAQHRMQTISDPFLGWTMISGRDYLVRQLADHKAAIATEDLAGRALREYAYVCGRLLAKAHARTGDPAVLTGYCGASDKLDVALRKFAVAYAEQTTADHASLGRAIRAGRVRARKGL